MVRLSNQQIAVEISRLGAELQSLRSQSDGAEWLWQGDGAWWTGRSPLLFPIIGQCPDGEIAIEGQTYAMRSHGFARNSEFDLIAQSETSAEFVLLPNEISCACYPFEFRLTLLYALQESSLTLTARVENRDSRAMPFQFGFHPAFVWPLPHNEGQPHFVRFLDREPSEMRRLANGLMADERLAPPLNGNQIAMNPDDYRADAMIFPELAATSIRFEGGSASITMETEGLPDFALWQKPGAPFLCLEPWHGMAPYPEQGKALAARPNAILLQPGRSQSFKMQLSLSHG